MAIGGSVYLCTDIYGYLSGNIRGTASITQRGLSRQVFLAAKCYETVSWHRGRLQQDCNSRHFPRSFFASADPHQPCLRHLQRCMHLQWNILPPSPLISHIICKSFRMGNSHPSTSPRHLPATKNPHLSIFTSFPLRDCTFCDFS